MFRFPSFGGPPTKPQIKNRFSGAAKVGGDTKVPTVIYYGPAGSPRAIGAETEPGVIEAIEEEAD